MSSRAFSHEIHGVRGLALTMVVAFHLFGQGRVSGGVDVFLVISAYLMTGSMIRSLQDGKLSLVHRYGKTFSRLLPPALLTIVFTVVAGLITLPRSRWLGLFEGAQASSVFMENVYLGTAGLTYEAAGDSASPFQHFWSLSAQGQFLILWPLLAFLILKLFSRISGDTRVRIFFGFTLVVTGASFLYALWLVGIDQPVAYYSLWARMWEFGAGALAAFIMPWLQSLRKPLVGALGWMGIALILSSGFLIDGATKFPGAWALWPVMGAVLVLISADTGGAKDVGLTSVLSWKPIAWLANRGYPLYLWHWPLLVYFLSVKGQASIGYLGAAAVLAASLILSELSTRYVSAPAVRGANGALTSPAGSGKLLAILIAAAVGVAALSHIGVRAEETRIQNALEKLEQTQGQVGDSGAVDAEQDALTGLLPPGPRDQWVPDPSVAQQDLPTIYSEGCVQNTRDLPESAKVLVCPDVPGPDAKETSDTSGTRPKVVMGGGSHVMQYYPAIRKIADEEGWELIVIDKDGCRLAVDNQAENQTDSCRKWNEEAPGVILAQDPDAVITLGSLTHGDENIEETIPDAQVAAWQLLSDEGIPVIVLRDTPRFPFKVPECLQTESDPLQCSATQETLYPVEDIFAEADLPENVVTVDVTDSFCEDGLCPPVIGNIVVYRDASHMTATFAKTLTDPIRAQLKEALPQLFSD